MADKDSLNSQNEGSHSLESVEEASRVKGYTSFMSGRTILSISVFVLVVVVYFGWIAVTNFVSMGIRAKLAEVPHNLEGIRTAELAYHAQHGEFRSAGVCPREAPGRQQSAWEGECTDVFKTLGWTPEGAVRCQYMAEAIPGEEEAADFKLTAQCDVDGDGVVSIFEASRHNPPKRVTPSHIY